MWMMGCRDSSGLNTSDSINGRKLRPLIPRPTFAFSSSSTPTTTTTTSSPSCVGRIHGTDFLSLHNHLGTIEHGKREMGAQPVSSRWNPTPEQLRTLEDLYRRGTRTPNAEQIQYITAQLRRYGKIEGKNVFYWFQNHKARERQKRKRRIEIAAAMQTNLENSGQERSKDFADTSRKVLESEGYKSWPSPPSCSTLAEESPLGYRPECKREGWVECNAQAYVPPDTQAAWQMMQLYSLPRLISTAPIVPPFSSPASNTPAAAAAAELPKLEFGEDFDADAEPSRTLELFPLRSDGIADKPSNASNYKFIQFLPLKN